MWNLKIYQASEYNRNRLTDVENELVVTSEELEGRRSKIKVGVKRYKLLCIK